MKQWNKHFEINNKFVFGIDYDINDWFIGTNISFDAPYSWKFYLSLGIGPIGIYFGKS